MALGEFDVAEGRLGVEAEGRVYGFGGEHGLGAGVGLIEEAAGGQREAQALAGEGIVEGGGARATAAASLGRRLD